MTKKAADITPQEWRHLQSGYTACNEWKWDTLVGGVAQWSGRQSLNGELSLIYAW